MPVSRRTAASAIVWRGTAVMGAVLGGGFLLLAAAEWLRQRIGQAATLEAEDLDIEDLEIEDQAPVSGGLGGERSAEDRPGPGGLGQTRRVANGRPGPGGLGAPGEDAGPGGDSRAVPGPSATMPSTTYEVPPGRRSAVPVNPVHQGDPVNQAHPADKVGPVGPRAVPRIGPRDPAQPPRRPPEPRA